MGEANLEKTIPLGKLPLDRFTSLTSRRRAVPLQVREAELTLHRPIAPRYDQEGIAPSGSGCRS